MEVTEIREAVIVDDQVYLSHVYERAFQRLGRKTWTFSTCAEATTVQLQTSSPVFLIDLIFPGEYGSDLIEHFRGKYPDSIIIAMTGQQIEGIRHEALNRGADTLLEKPFGFQVLEDAICGVLQTRGLENN